MVSLISLFLTQVVGRLFFSFVVLVVLTFACFYRRLRSKKINAKLPAPHMPPPEVQEERIARYQSQMFRANATGTANTAVAGGLGTTGVDARAGCHVTVRCASGRGPVRCLDLATEDFHSFSTHPDVVDVARKAVMAYGVGSCGPRGFYGTLKPHIDAEADLANFLGVEDAIIYSLSFATVSTLISCFAGRGEYLVVDEGVNLSVADGCAFSRANVFKYRHNDMAHLETLLKMVLEQEKKARKLSRRFVVTEGLFKNSGDICNLPRILELCHEYKFRIILEDSYGFGCLGPTARGTHEHFGIPTTSIDLYVGSLSTSLGAVGGFCAGDHEMVEYQRLTATGYVFSASLPPYITSCVSKALSLLDKDDSYCAKLQANAKFFRETLRRAEFNAEKISMVECEGDLSPIVVVRPTSAYIHNNPRTVEEELDRVVRLAREKRVLLLRHLFSEEEKCENIPGLRVLVKGQASREELQNAAAIFVDSVKTVFP